VSPRRWLTLAVLCIPLLIVSLDNTVLNVVLPTLVRKLRATTGELQWIVDAYVLVFGGLMLAAGSLADRIGRKRTFVVGSQAGGTTGAQVTGGHVGQAQPPFGSRETSPEGDRVPSCGAAIDSYPCQTLSREPYEPVLRSRSAQPCTSARLTTDAVSDPSGCRSRRTITTGAASTFKDDSPAGSACDRGVSVAGRN